MARLTHPLSLSDPELALVEVPKKKPPQPQIVNAAEKADPQIKARVQARKELLKQQQAKLTTSTPLPPPAPAPAVLSLLGGSDDDDEEDSEEVEEEEEKDKNQMDSDDYVWDDGHAKEHLDSEEDSSAAAAVEPEPTPAVPPQEEEPSVLVPLTAQQFENLSQSLSGRIPPKTRQRMPTLLSPPPSPMAAAAATSSNNNNDSSDSSLGMDLEEGQITPDREMLASRFTHLDMPVPAVCDTVEKEQAIDGAFYIVGDHLPRMYVGVGGPPSGQQMLPASAHHGQSITPQLLARAKNHADLSKAIHTLLQLAEPAQAYLDSCFAK